MVPILLVLALSLAVSDGEQQQGEKPVDSSSSRVSIPGCLRGRNLVVIDPSGREGEPVGTGVEPGRVFRLSGPKKLLKELSKRDRSAVEVTGLVRKSALDQSTQGMPINAGGSIRTGAGPPVSSDPTRTAGRDPVANVPLLDVESFRPIDAACPTKGS